MQPGGKGRCAHHMRAPWALVFRQVRECSALSTETRSVIDIGSPSRLTGADQHEAIAATPPEVRVPPGKSNGGLRGAMISIGRRWGSGEGPHARLCEKGRFGYLTRAPWSFVHCGGSWLVCIRNEHAVSDWHLVTCATHWWSQERGHCGGAIRAARVTGQGKRLALSMWHRASKFTVDLMETQRQWCCGEGWRRNGVVWGATRDWPSGQGQENTGTLCTPYDNMGMCSTLRR